SPTAGTVTFAGDVAGRPVLVVTHPGGLRSTLEPATASVPVGTAAGAGASVGTVNATPGHCAPATCVHWGVLRGGTYLDPLRFVSTPRVVLLPLEP
ncbi:MAG: M23 family metallopeptidase, partial [Actinomycetota bacterium]|nr:M23 family metallopeptidase [Actinomycetota bacterium]